MMDRPEKRLPYIQLIVLLVFFFVAAFPGQGKAVHPGEELYRNGILPSGEPVEAFVKGDIPVSGTFFSCVSCHLRSGLGSFEGQILTPPTTGKKLFQAQKPVYRGLEVIAMPPRRPAYTDESLAEVIRGGIDPTGRTLDEVMPRYLLNDADMAILIDYLKALSSEYSPGASAGAIRFATVIAGDVSSEEAEAMLTRLENYFRLKNLQAGYFETDSPQALRARSKRTSRAAEYLKLSLSRWVLKGPPSTWRGQLEEYYRREPVFALVGGITKGDWKPVHEFSEANQIPCLFPVTDFPAISETDWYTMYLSRGYYQEGESAALYLNSRGDVPGEGTVLQVVRDSREGLALAEGFQETWQGLGHKPPLKVLLKAGETLTADALELLLSGERPSGVALWLDSGAFPLLESLAAGGKTPDIVLVSSGYIGSSLPALPERARGFTYITYPYKLPQANIKASAAVSASGAGAKRTAQQTDALLQVFTMGIREMRGNHYRDNFLDVLGMIRDQMDPLYERLSFGPGQRYASKGCYIVQLSSGADPELIKKSGWVIH